MNNLSLMKNVITVLVLIGLVVYGAYEYVHKAKTEEANSEIGHRKGQIAPDFALKDAEGNTVRLSDYQGKKVLLNFWATWCPPCRAEMPHMQKFYADYQAKDVVILGVNLTHTEKNAENVKAFAQKLQITFPIVLDQEGHVTETFQVSVYPTTFLLDSNGVIREKFQGAIHYDVMKEAVSNIE